MKTLHRAGLGSLLAGGAAVLLTILLAFPAYATRDLNTVIDSLRNWVADLLAALATPFPHHRRRALPHRQRQSAGG